MAEPAVLKEFCLGIDFYYIFSVLFILLNPDLKKGFFQNETVKSREHRKITLYTKHFYIAKIRFYPNSYLRHFLSSHKQFSTNIKSLTGQLICKQKMLSIEVSYTV